MNGGKKKKSFTDRTERRVRRIYLVLFMVGVGAALAYFVAYPMLVRRGRIRSTADRTQQHQEDSQLDKLRQKYAVLSNDYSLVVDKATAQGLRVEELEKMRLQATEELATLTADRDRLRQELEDALGRNVRMEQEQISQAEKQEALNARLVSLQEDVATCAAENSRLQKERVPRADYEALQALTAELDTALGDLQKTLTQLGQENEQLGERLRSTERELATVLSAADEKRLGRDLLGTVVAARLRLLEYDVDFAFRKMSALREQLALAAQEASAGDLRQALQAAQQTVDLCLERLQESRGMQ
jgi:septal ring factor EnvC (AmiA/AmiB activator)